MARKTSCVFLWNCDKVFHEFFYFVIPSDSAQDIQIKIIDVRLLGIYFDYDI